MKTNFLQTKLFSVTKALPASPDILVDITIEYGGSNNPNAVIEDIKDNTKFSMFYAVTPRQSMWPPSFADHTVIGVVGGIHHVGFGSRVSS